MVRKTLKKTTKHPKIKNFLKKTKIPNQYFATNKKMISKGVLIGLVIAFIPMPMQMAFVLTIIPFTKFNVPIALAMCWLSNPLTMPLMYYIEYLTGAYIMGIETQNIKITIDWFMQNIDNIFIPLYIGTAFYSIFISTSIYMIINFLWNSSVKKERNKKRINKTLSKKVLK